MSITISFRPRSWLRVLYAALGLFFLRWLLFPPASENEIAHHNVIERVTRGTERILDVQKHPWLQSRIGRDERRDILDDFVDDGTNDFWNRFQHPLSVSDIFHPKSLALILILTPLQYERP